MANATTGNVLIIEDQGVNRMLLCHYLEENDYQVTTVESFEAAVYQAHSDKFQLVLLNLYLQNMDGFELLSAMRSSRNLAELPIIAMSSLAEDEDKQRAFETGANDFIIKPISEDELLAKVKTFLQTQQLYRSMHKQEERCVRAIKGSHEGIWDWDIKNNTFFFSEHLSELFCPDEKAASKVGTPQDWFDHIHPDDYSRVLAEIEDHLHGKTPYFESQHRLLQKDGTNRWVLARGTVSANEDEDDSMRMTGTICDISRSLTYDNVTGLPSKHVFLDLLERSLARIMRNENSKFALLIVAIDNFDSLIKSLGLAETDKLLATVSRRLQLSSRSSDIISRLRNDRFAVILDDIRDISDSLRVANRITNSIQDPIRLVDRQFTITTSIGISVSNSRYESPEAILADAEQATSAAQAAGGDRCLMCSDEYQKYADRRLSLEQNLYEAVAAQQFFLQYLPIVNQESGVLYGFEPLLRWRLPDGTVLLPNEFLHLCGRDQLIISIGYWVMKKAAEQYVTWEQSSPQWQGTLTINLSERQFYDSDLVNNVKYTLETTGLSPENLAFEVSESDIAINEPQALTICQALRNLSIKVGVDNYNGKALKLTTLSKLPIAYFKTDSSMLIEKSDSQSVWNALEIIRHIATCNNAECIVTGVETKQNSAHLKEIGLMLQEGFLFSQPMTGGAADNLITRLKQN